MEQVVVPVRPGQAAIGCVLRRIPLGKTEWLRVAYLTMRPLRLTRDLPPAVQMADPIFRVRWVKRSQTRRVNVPEVARSITELRAHGRSGQMRVGIGSDGLGGGDQRPGNAWILFNQSPLTRGDSLDAIAKAVSVI